MYFEDYLNVWSKQYSEAYKNYLDLFSDSYNEYADAVKPTWNYMENMYRYFGILNQLNDPVTDWTTYHEEVYSNQTLRLMYFPSPNRNPSKRPILVLPPQAAHHSDLADFSPAQSLVRVFQRYGYDAYACHWLSATDEYKNLGIADYIRLTNEAVDYIREKSGFYKIHIMGQCQGGWQATIYTSLNQDKIASLSIAAAPIDVNAESSEIVRMAQDLPIEVFELMVSLGNGRMNGQYMLMGFKSMQAEEHYIKKYYRLWDMIIQNDQEGLKRFINFENWYEYTQYLPGRFYLEIIKNIFRANNLTKPNALVLDGRGVDLRNINCPIIILAGAKDHITPPAQCFALKKFVSTPEEDVVEILTNGGHIGTLMGTESLREDWTAVAEILELSI